MIHSAQPRSQLRAIAAIAPRHIRRGGRSTRLGQSGFGITCQPACSSGGTLCAEPDSFLASLNPCCWVTYTEQPNDGYCGGGASPTVAALTGATTGSPTCSAGGVLCPDPTSTGAFLNPCCGVASPAAGAPAPVASIPAWAYVVGGLLLFAVLSK